MGRECCSKTRAAPGVGSEASHWSSPARRRSAVRGILRGSGVGVDASSQIRRVKWTPNTDTGIDKKPWKGLSYDGDLLKAATDANNTLYTWRPHDQTTYWCHGYTFGGSVAQGGPYSIWGNDVPGVLVDDGWKRVDAGDTDDGDVLTFYGYGTSVLHTGVVRSVVTSSGLVDESASTLESKWGTRPLSTSSWATNVAQYGLYRAFSKSPTCRTGAHGSSEYPVDE